MQLKNWENSLLLNPHVAHAAEFVKNQPKPLPTFDLHYDEPTFLYPYQHNVFWIFSDAINTSEKTRSHLPDVTDISRHILADILADLFSLYSHNHRVLSAYLLNFRNFFSSAFTGQYQIDEAIIESLLAHIVGLPKPHTKTAYYTIVTIDLCNNNMEKFPPVLGRAVRTMWERLDGPDAGSGMDVECIRRFAEWFSQHLSNFGYVWKWEDWFVVLFLL